MARRGIALAIVCFGAAVVFVATGEGAEKARALTPTVIAGVTPTIVSDGAAVQTSTVSNSTVLTLDVGLAVRDSAGLDALIQAASTPGTPQYGHYLTQAQYLATYAPTDAQAAAASSWLTAQGLTVASVSPDNLLIRTQGTVGQIEHAFGVSIDNYNYNGRLFHANDTDPTLPGGLQISWVTGLSNLERFKTFRSANFRTGGYFPSDFRQAYNVSGTGTGQTIGFTLWGDEVQQSDFTSYASVTGTTAITIGSSTSAADGLNWVEPLGNPETETDTLIETAMDAELAHGMAPSSHLTYYLGSDSSDSTMDYVVNAAANSSISTFSNSWGCTQGVVCPVDPTLEASLQHAAGVGKTFFFSTGDSGQDVGASWPAYSQYVVAVGGTSLTTNGSGNYPSTPEPAWSGSGGGCFNTESRPSWQTGVTATLVGGGACSGRAEPDIAAAADPNRGAFVYVARTGCTNVGTNECLVGGTSLATPLWAGMAADWAVINAAAGKAALGFVGPLIYQLANDAPTYALDFHDVTSGSNGFLAGAGWDEVTGWGSPNFGNLTKTASTNATTAATSVAATSAQLNGTVNPNGLSTTTYFEYGPTTSYGTQFPLTPVNQGSGVTTVVVSASLTGLTPGSTYHYRIDSVSGGVTVNGTDQSFTTLTTSHYAVSTSASTTAGTPITVTVQALDGSNIVDGTYRGTVHFTSSDGAATLPANYAFTVGDAGSHTFSVTPNTSGSQTFTVTDVAASAVTGTSGSVTVSPGPTNHLSVTTASSVTTGGALSVTVKAVDAHGNVTPTYLGSIGFTSSDSGASLPSGYTFVGGDAGSHAFSATLNTAGTQTVTATDTVTLSITGSASISVQAPVPVTTTTTSSGGGGGGGGGGNAPPNVHTTLSSSGSPSGIGAAFSYVVTLTNQGVQGSSSTTLTVGLPAGVSLVSSQVDRGPGCTASGQTVTCPLDFFPVGLTQHVILNVTVTALGSLVCTASTVSVPPDSNPADGSAVLTLNAGSATPVTSTPVSSSPAPAPAKTASTAGITDTGNAKANTIDGGAKNDVLSGGGGNDTLSGGAGNDKLNGGTGNDKLNGGTGNDILNGGAGNDVITGGPGQDTIFGGPGNDTIYAKDGSKDTIDCGTGKDTVYADKKDAVAKNCEIVHRS